MRKSLLVLILIFLSVSLFSQEEVLKSVPVKDSDYSMKFDGVFRGRYQLSTDTWRSMFSVANARVGFGGDVTKYLAFRTQVELSGDGKFAVLDLFGSIMPTDWLTLKFGQQHISIFNNYIVSHREMLFSNLTFLAEYMAPTRDMGLVGEFKIKSDGFPILLQMGIFNGGTINQPMWRDTFSYSGRVIFGSMKGFRTSVKMYRFLPTCMKDYLVLGVDLRYEWDSFMIEAEAMNRHNYYDGDDLLATYIQGAYFIHLKNDSGMFKKIIPALRWDTMCHDAFSGGYGINRITAGMGFAFEVMRISSVLRLDYEVFLGNEQMPEFQPGVVDGAVLNRMSELTSNKLTLELAIEF